MRDALNISKAQEPCIGTRREYMSCVSKMIVLRYLMPGQLENERERL